MEEKKHILKSAGQVGGATLLSRLLGLVRDILCAAFFGATTLWDAFVLAYTVPNLFRRLFGEGALTAAFVPVFTDSLIHEERRKSWHFASTTITALALILTAIVVVIELFLFVLSRTVILPEKYTFAISLSYILLPYTILICIAALFMGILNSLKHFLIPALSPALLNIVWIGALLLFHPFIKYNPQGQTYVLAVAIIIGGAIQAGMQIPVLYKKGFRYRFSLDFKLPQFRKIIFLMGPTVIGVAVFQINVLVDRLLAFFLREGAASVLFFSNRLVQLPLALFGISLATAILPSISRSVSTQNMEEFKNTLVHGLNMLLVILIPATAGLIILGVPITNLIFQRGAFTHSDSVRTGITLACYASGLFAFAAYKIIVQGFYARKDMITPVKIGAWCVLLNFVLNLLLMFPLKEAGLALATSITSYVNLYLLYKKLSRETEKIEKDDYLDTLLKVILSTIAMAICCFGLLSLLKNSIVDPSLLGKFFIVVCPLTASVCIVTFLYHILKVKEFTEIISLVKTKLKK